ncbi:MAG: VCBS repeat-containing protein, partial [Myxococcales bacterium]|nr:VCBS repeat-containing protein [Myxococcales bacterium]
VADVDGDGRPDLLSANFDEGTISLVLNLGDRSFAPAQAFAAGPKPNAVVAADVSGDGLPDLVSADSGSDTITIHPSIPGGFAEPRTFYVDAGPYDLDAGDLDGDGRADLMVAVYGAARVAILLTGTPL